MPVLSLLKFWIHFIIKNHYLKFIFVITIIPDTGLALNLFEQRNNLIRKYDEHASIMAFIPGTTLRGPLYKGLPTIEQHRHMTLLQSAHSLLKYNLDYILIGDTAINYASSCITG